MSLQMVWYDSMQKPGGSRGMPARKYFIIRCSEIVFSGRFDHINLQADASNKLYKLYYISKLLIKVYFVYPRIPSI